MSFAKYPVSGGVTGPGVSTNNGVVLFDGTSGAIIKDLGVGSANQVLLTNGTIPSFGAITNAYIDSGAAIALSKLAALTASRALVSNGSGVISVSSVTDTELGYVSGVTSAIQTQLNAKANDSAVVHISGTETITGAKTFSSIIASSLTSNQFIAGNVTLSFTNSGTPTTITIPNVAPFATIPLLENAQTFTAQQSFSNNIVVQNRVIVFGTSQTITILGSTPASSRFVTIPEAGADSDFVLTAGSQTIGGSKTLSSAVTINPASNQVILSSGVNQLTLNSGTSAAARTYTVPDTGTTDTFAMLGGAQTFTALKTFNSGLAIAGGAAANNTIWVASNVLRQRGGTSGWAVDNTSGNAILSATDAGAFNFPVATTHVFGSISGSSPTGIRVDAASSIERTIFITQAGTARLGLLANTSNELFLLSNNQTLRFSTDAGTTTHASINTSGLFSINNGLSVTGTTTLPATVNYTSAGSIVKSGAGALTLSNANASTLSIPTAGTYTFPTAIGTLIGSGDTGTVSDTMLAGSISDTKLSTITTAGKVSNSATTATSTNTANAIVARDASGNFSAGTITASLNGNASTASTLQTARTINGTSFNGSANITITDGSSLGSLNANNITTGTLAVARGGTGVSSSTGSGSVVLNTSPSLTGLTVNSSSGNLTTINTSDSVAVFNHNSNVSFGVVASLRTSTSGSSTADGPKLHFFRSDGSVNWTVGIAETPSNANWRLNSGGNESGFGTPVMEFTTAGAGFVGPAGNTQTFTVRGALTKTSGSFKIDHPLPSKKDTHYLVHSFVEAPNADNIYRGKVTLIDGNAIINLDTAGRMTEGTFVLLNTNTQSFCSNETGWSAVKSSISGNILTITAEDTLSTDTISWLVIGERHDQHMLDTNWTDENGRVITEPLKEPNS